MEYRKLGPSGIKVSSLCLGTMTFGEADEKSFMHQVGASEEAAFQIMNRSLDAGINFFDTADVYGQDGLTERVIGKWFQTQRRRDEVILATKCRFRMAPGPNGTGASRYRIVRAVEESLRRLATDRIDLYQIHMQDIETPEEETLRALDDLVRSGKVLYVGASNYAGYRLMDSLWTSQTKNLIGFVALQTQYSLVERNIEREVVPACQRFGLGILPWAPLAAGFLSGKFRRGETPPEGSRLAKWRDSYARHDNDRSWATLDVVRSIAAEIGSTPARVSLAWALAKPSVTSVIFGARSVSQLEDNLAAAETKLTPEHMKQLDEVSAPDWGYPYRFIANIQGRW